MNELPSGIPLREAVYRALCQAIRDGLYKPGSRLREDQIAERFEVSRTPVREALGLMLAKGFIEPSGGRGLVVRSPNTQDVLDLYALREILEGAAARLAAKYASQPEIDSLYDLLQSFEGQLDNIQELGRIYDTIHQTIVKSARNRYLDSAHEELQITISMLAQTTFSVPGRPAASAQELRKLIDAIAQRDLDLAEKLARAHIQESLRYRLKLMKTVPETKNHFR